ncbi:hypothetical protein [Cognatilysobacter segetis]|uniref:hypothetical protein n=1 Tax=Cognatilysobacter segetis TaxID=2492394 RepID=UPI001061AAA7|nr:hypothetical protein [Lysobacter segetis]
MGTSFKQLIEKVDQAENALEAQERLVAADWRQLRASWRAGWTPGRIVLAGLVAGFVVGRVEPAKSVAKGGSIMQMITALSGLFASATAQQAASQVDDVASDVGEVADSVQASVPTAAVDPVDLA